MKARRLSEVARAVGGAHVGTDVEVTSVATDSREADPGSLFFALRGERTDGSLFVADAFASGAAAVVARDDVAVGGPVVRVSSPEEALLRLASDERLQMEGVSVVAVTGANGKTSTKDLAAALLSPRFRVHASSRSLNNEVGLPVTLLSAPEGVEAIVAEMGARRRGDVRLLCEVARPYVAVVTNVGVAHIGVFGGWEAIVEASAEPVEALGGDGFAVLNADDHVVAGYAGRTRARSVTFGVSSGADVRADNVDLDRDGRASFELVYGGDRERVELAVAGEHMVSNALAAAACGIVLGMTPAECAAGLKDAKVSPWRMESFTSVSGIRVLNDAYNANPESMAAALRTARWMAGEARLFAVLGTMAELGSISPAEHGRVGELAARLSVDRLITVGADAAPIAASALREGVEPENVASYEGGEEALRDVLEHARPGDLVLFKASRVVGLERLAEAMR